MTCETIKMPLLETNKGQLEGLPKNPRFIRDNRYKALKRSIEESPEMLKLRELWVYPLENGHYVIVSGNHRYRACRERYDFVIPKGTRIAQLVVERIERPDVVEVKAMPDTERGDGGFGHTGI